MKSLKSIGQKGVCMKKYMVNEAANDEEMDIVKFNNQ